MRKKKRQRKLGKAGVGGKEKEGVQKGKQWEERSRGGKRPA